MADEGCSRRGLLEVVISERAASPRVQWAEGIGVGGDANGSTGRANE
jgi:hypothetical protein